MTSTLSASDSITAVCISCRLPILDRYVMQAIPGRLEWHADCLRCFLCGSTIGELSTCFIRNGHVYCKVDYNRFCQSRPTICKRFAECCHLSSQQPSATDCTGHHHLMTSSKRATFLSSKTASSAFTGDSIGGCEISVANTPAAAGSRRKVAVGPALATKKPRMRTVLSERQLYMLKSCYAMTSRPDQATKDQLSEMTGLSTRVIRVWFQNRRCKDKKSYATDDDVYTSIND